MSAAMEPRIQYAKTSDGVNIAYCVAGEGRNLLWVWPPPFSHVQLDWETVSSHIFQPLAKNQRLVWFDWPGTGLSDRDSIDFSMEAMTRAIETVVARTSLEKFSICATLSAVPIALTYAAEWPERISHLIFVDGWTQFSEVEQSAARQAEKGATRQRLGHLLGDFRKRDTSLPYARCVLGLRPCSHSLTNCSSLLACCLAGTLIPPSSTVPDECRIICLLTHSDYRKAREATRKYRVIFRYKSS